MLIATDCLEIPGERVGKGPSAGDPVVGTSLRTLAEALPHPRHLLRKDVALVQALEDAIDHRARMAASMVVSGPRSGAWATAADQRPRARMRVRARRIGSPGGKYSLLIFSRGRLVNGSDHSIFDGARLIGVGGVLSCVCVGNGAAGVPFGSGKRGTRSCPRISESIGSCTELLVTAREPVELAGDPLDLAGESLVPKRESLESDRDFIVTGTVLLAHGRGQFERASLLLGLGSTRLGHAREPVIDNLVEFSSKTHPVMR